MLFVFSLSAVGEINEIKPNDESYCTFYTYPPIKTTSTYLSYSNMFKQKPKDPNDPLKNSYTSDSGTYNMLVYEDFWNISNSIREIHWWGFSMKWVVFGWVSCDPNGMKIDITFYEDNAKSPGNKTTSYIDVEYTVKGTGIFYEWFGGNLHELLYFEVKLNPHYNQSEGWVSIQSRFSPNGCSFLWMNSDEGNGCAYQYQPPLTKLNDDLAFILTDGKSDVPDLECSGRLSWSNVDPGSLVNGNFTVENIGRAGTLLDWNVEIHPNWGSWTFEPKDGKHLEPGLPIVVEVSVYAPQNDTSEFTGEILIVNTDNSSDNCTIPVYLKTPKIKQVMKNYGNRLLDQVHSQISLRKQRIK
jgi:hypothetical protein